MRLAVLGLGRIGHALAQRLLAGGHDVTVWNRTPGKADDLLARCAREAATSAAAVPASSTSGAAQAAGLPDELIRDFLGQLPLPAPALRNRLEDIISGDHDGWFMTTLGAKDVRLAEDLARSRGLRLPLADAVRLRFEEAAAQGWADADIGAVVELLREHGDGS